MADTNLRSTIPQVFVKVNGQRLPEEAFAAILESTIESSLHLPDACTIRIHDNDFKWLDSQHWKEGNEILIEAGQGKQDQLHKVFEGEVVGIEMDLAGMGVTTLTVRCMDKAHRLHRGKKRRSWLKKQDSEIVNEVARDLGLQCRADNTSEIHDWTLQNNQSDWDFLSGLAQRNGCRLYLEDKTKLVFEKVQDVSSATTALEWGKDLRSFRIRVNSGNQVGRVVVRGWDIKTKRSIVAQADTPRGTSQIGMRSSGAQTARSAFGQAESVVVDRPINSQRQAEEIAKSVMDDIGTSFIEADGLCYNHPQLAAGDTIELKNIGNRFNGKYILTSVTHTFSPAEGLSSQFVISGKQPATLLSVLGGGGGGASSGSSASPSASPNAGNIVVGIVTDNQDPDGLFRVKVKFPWLSDDIESSWARIASPMAGNGRGFHFLPEIDDEVLVAFEHGDISRPYILGALWNGKDLPAISNSNAKGGGSAVNHRRIKTRYGHILDLEDTGGEERIVLQTPGGQRIVLRDGSQGGVSLINKNGLEFFSDNQGQIGFVSQKGLGISLDEVKQYATIYDAAGNFITLNPGSIDISATAMVNIKGSGMMNIQASMVNINTGAASGMKKQPSPDKGHNKEARNS